MNQERLMKVIVAPVISEKATMVVRSSNVASPSLVFFRFASSVFNSSKNARSTRLS